MMRITVTDVAWFTLAQAAAAAGDGTAVGDPAADDPAADDPAADDPAADDEAAAGDPAADDVARADDGGAAAGDEAVTEPHPASAEHSSTASTVPRTWRGDIMLL
jgi:hypothetical protein